MRKSCLKTRRAGSKFACTLNTLKVARSGDLVSEPECVGDRISLTQRGKKRTKAAAVP